MNRYTVKAATKPYLLNFPANPDLTHRLLCLTFALYTEYISRMGSYKYILSIVLLTEMRYIWVTRGRLFSEYLL